MSAHCQQQLVERQAIAARQLEYLLVEQKGDSLHAVQQPHVAIGVPTVWMDTAKIFLLNLLFSMTSLVLPYLRGLRMCITFQP